MSLVTQQCSVVLVLFFSILVLDVASNRKILQALLNNNGAKDVDTAENGQEAVEAALANPQKYDIIFMDNLMPVMVPLEIEHDTFLLNYLILF